MNVETDIKAFSESPSVPAHIEDLFKKHLTALSPLHERRERLSEMLNELIKVGDRATIERARRLMTRLNEVEPAITMIGQVKAGKTSLVNALVGMPGLLPSDVNPWTSVVTSLHLDPALGPAHNGARFEFLDKSDWDRLIKGGGRIGELARRAGADSELKRVTEQVSALREKSRKRLGSKFEMLLGQEHDYGYFDGDLIERYVCLGDDFEDDTDVSRDRGRFADITKAAHITMGHAASPIKLCLRDTPGVNDTFLVREQITMKAIRGSQLCVVVLAAHQALSTVDLALVRLISNLKSRDVIFFVNRIDELMDPGAQVPEIRESIKATLKAHQGPLDAEIVFGSADWANRVISGELSGMYAQSAEALLSYTRSQLDRLPSGLSEEEIVWHLAGMSTLQNAIANRVQTGAGDMALQAIERSTRNLLNGIKITDMQALEAAAAPKPEVDATAAKSEFEELKQHNIEALETGLSKMLSDFSDRIARVHDGYLDRATAALIQHLETSEKTTAWHYDPTGLRMLLRSSYRTHAKRSKDLINGVFQATADDVSTFFDKICPQPDGGYALALPTPPQAPEPVVLGKTIALDLPSNWWSSWWQRKSDAKGQTEKFRDLIAAETEPMLNALKEECAGAIKDAAQTLLNEMIEEQRAVLDQITRGSSAQPERQTSKRATRLEMVDRALASLSRHQAEEELV